MKNQNLDKYSKKEKELNTEKNSEIISKPENIIFVDIKGSVLKPGMYELKNNTRLGELIEKSGGLTQANVNCVNLAKKLKDEDVIYIPNKKEKCESYKSLSQNNNIPKENNSDLSQNTSVNKININTATKEELITLNGIGETRAQEILDYRENKKFQTKEELMEVKGIGNTTYQKIANEIII